MSSIVLDSISKSYGPNLYAVRDLSITIEEGEFMVFVGPSGCGKSTALRMVAGLTDISSGDLYIGGKRVNDLGARERDISMVFQNYALYPHMTVEQNIAFPLQSRHVSKADIAARVRGAAEKLELTDYLGRKPGQLSGGQRQRVAMGRAIVREPQAFLMDEPLSNLDAKLRNHMRAEIIDVQRSLGVTTLYVTHDQTEAMTMGHRIAVLRSGELQQVGTPMELYDRPANLFVAAFLGAPSMNLIQARVATRGGRPVAVLPDAEIELDPASVAKTMDGREIVVGFRPEHLSLAEPGSSGSIAADPVLVEDLPPERMVHAQIHATAPNTDAELEIAADIDASTAQQVAQQKRKNQVRLIARLPIRTDVRAHMPIALRPDPAFLHLFDAATGVRLD